jgi:hypothetical protein
MRHFIFLLNQIGIVLLVFAFSMFGEKLDLLTIVSDDFSLFSTIVGFIFIYTALFYMVRYLVKSGKYSAKYAVYKTTLLLICETGLAFIATALTLIKSGDAITGSLYLIMALTITWLSSGGLVVLKHFFFDKDEI